MPLSISYYGENALHPGVKLGTYHTIWSVEKSRTHRRKKLKEKYEDKQKLKELYLDFNIGGYSHPNNHNGYFVSTGLTLLRTTLRKKRQLGISLEVGYLRRNYKFTTYELDTNGEIQEVKGAGNNSLLLGLAPQIAKEFSISDSLIRIYLKPTIQLVHYAYRLQPNTAVEVGAVFNIHRKRKS